MRSLIAFCLLLCFLTAKPQAEDYQKSLEGLKDRERMLMLENLSRQFENSDVKLASRLAKEAFTIAENLSDQEKKQRLCGWIGNLMRLQNNYDSSALFYEQALAIAAEREDVKSRAEYLNGLSQVFRAKGSLSQSTQYALEAHRAAEQSHDLKQAGDALYNIGFVHQTQQSYDSALLYFNKSLFVRRQLADSTSVASSYNGIGLVYMRKENYDESRRWFLKVVRLLDPETSPRQMAMVYNNIGITYEDQGMFKEGRDYYNKSLALKNKLGDKRGMASTYGNLGDNYRESGNPDEAIKFAKLSRELSIETKSLDYLITAHKLMALSYEQKGDYKNAYANYVLYHDFQDSLFNTNKARQVNDMITRYNVEKKDEENKKLKASAAMNETALSRQKFIIIGAAVSLGGILFIMNFLYSLYSRSKKLAADLAVQKAQVEQVNTQLNLAMQENTNITHFMVHDLRAPLNKVAAFTDLIQKDGSLNNTQSAYATKVMEVVDQGRKLIDDLLTINKPHDVRPNQFDSVKLLKDLIQQYSSLGDQKKIRIHSELPTQPVVIESDSDLVGRVLDNLLSNAIKFSPTGSKVYVTLKVEDNWVSISIRDEGPGFTESDKKFLYQKFKRLSARPTNGEPSNGLGLAIARTIVDELGGTILLNTQEGKGATFTVLLHKKQA